MIMLKRIKLAVAVVFAAVVLTLGLGMTRIDDRLMPIVTAQTNEMARNIMNRAIDASLVYAGAGLDTSDFVVKTFDADGMVLSLNVNTMLVNLVCNAMAVNMSSILGPPKSERLHIPIGSLLNVDVFGNVGPTIPVSFRYVGGAVVDYETEFRAVGINQVNFRLWVVVDSSIRVVNPLEDKDVMMTRKIALIDTVFSGRVPHMYLNMGQGGGFNLLE
ncbi:MAG: sporulation protein YunB [Defluviitaleaceae bacterium]|nr:sporulation protein YunB [Defluviitaleaceae bacterium]